jgi:hypothetical protein
MSTRWLGSTYSSSDGNACIVLAYSASGAALMNTWLIMVHANLLPHLLLTLLWLSPAVLSMLRIRRAKLENGREVPRLVVHLRPDTRIAGIGWPIVLLITGCSLGLLVVAGSAVLLGVFAIGCSIVPWSRVRLCRQRPVSASLVMCSGGACVVALYRQDVEFMFLPIAAWVLGMAALGVLLGTTRKKLTGKPPENADPVPVRP